MPGEATGSTGRVAQGTTQEQQRGGQGLHVYREYQLFDTTRYCCLSPLSTKAVPGGSSRPRGCSGGTRELLAVPALARLSGATRVKRQTPGAAYAAGEAHTHARCV